MGLNATLYIINRDKFELLREKPDEVLLCEYAIYHQVFNQNFEALRYILKKIVLKEYIPLFDEIFYPKQYIGHLIEFESINYKDINNLKDEKWPIAYLPPDKVETINNLLKKIDKHTFLENYNAEELNNYGVYPFKWHNGNSINNEFNRKQIETGFIDLVRLFEMASSNKYYILVVVGS